MGHDHEGIMKQRGWLVRIGSGALVVAAVVLGPQLFGRCAASCSGYDDALVQTVEHCPRARELLGDDIGPAVVGVSCGSTETGGGTGQASWRMSFSGTRGRGALHFDAEQHAGQWSVTRAWLDAEGEDIDLLACARSAAAPPVPAEAEASRSLVDRTVEQCRAGDAIACVSAGAMYESGHLVLRDVERARGLYHDACAAGHAPGCRLETELEQGRH